MRSIVNFVILLAATAFLFVGCEKVAELPNYKLGHPVTLTPSATTLTPAVGDSAKNVLTLNWTFPQYATDSANMKYIIELDSTGRNFSKEITSTQTKKLSKTFTGRDLNKFLLNYGYTVGTPVKLDMRVTSSYANNNEKYLSNVIQVTITPYSDPSKLTTEKTDVSGTAATSTNHSNTFSWSPSFPGYSGTVTYSLQYDSAGKNFAAPLEIAAGSSVYSKSMTEDDMNTTALSSGIPIGSSGKVEYRVKATTASGSTAYSNVVTVTIATFSPVPANLYIVGDATPGGDAHGWDNPVPVPSQQFTKVDAYSFSITIGLTAGKGYLFLPVNGSWDHKYGGATDGVASAGTLLKDGAVPGSNTPAPAASGVYQIVVNFQTNTYSVTQIAVPSNLFITGDATSGGWMVGGGVGVPVPSQQFTKLDNVSFGIVVNLNADKSYLFLPVNGDWGHKFGSSGADNTNNVNGDQFKAEGSNMKAPSSSGLYLIIVNFATSSWTVAPYTGPSNLFITGDATAGGWMVGNGVGVPVPSQQFTQNVTGIFQLTLPLNADKSFLLLPVNGDWGHKFGGTGADNTNNVNGDFIKAEGSNLKAPVTSATYTITVNFINMTYKVQ